ncbi:MlaD family protein [Nocardia asteroides]|uniref:Mce family protein n=1 Tax=Nocardia asteroides NBRC 15531 TaxID=1110697 RepID=U5E708_NOCAS|nr:MCE family protein [Nocardia asteroides]TLF69102.1 MCE family protein [Nocardia asteroides NBRC 15531]UGT48577.1 MCE family protein [Nocardia asteroides]GAD83055.1 Mce family protein [Nocardia asteroides NBRC 15531]
MIIDPSGRGPTMKQLYVAGACGLVVFALILGFLMARYQGYFVPKVNVAANLSTTGDGLPSDADVKFRGVLVGVVKDVEIVDKGTVQKVNIELKPEFAGDIPANVTARVVPSNLFAVTSVELVFNGASNQYLHEGSQIPEDTSQGTVALQDTLTTVRDILNEVDPVQLGRVLGTLTQALDGSGRVPGSTIQRLDHWLTTVADAGPNLGGMLDNFSASARALNESAPELLDVLGSSVQTANTIATKRDQLIALLAGASATTDRVNDLFAANPDVGKEVTVGMNATLGALAADPGSITKTFDVFGPSLAALNSTMHGGPAKQMVWNAGLTFTPYKPNTVADCPRYGDLLGPSCFTAPSEVSLPPMPESVRPKALASAAGLPPLVAIPGMPAIPGLTTPGIAPMQTANGTEVKPFAGTPLEGLVPPIQLPGLPGLLGGGAPAPAAGPAAAPADAPQPAVAPAAKPISYQGEAAMTQLLGRKPTASEFLLLGPIMKGGTLQVSENGGGA